MLRKILKWTGGVIATLIAGILISYFVMRIKVNNSLVKLCDVQVRMPDIPSDSATMANGAHIYATKGCGDCHGADGAGKFFIEDGMVGSLSVKNRTRGKGGHPAGCLIAYLKTQPPVDHDVPAPVRICGGAAYRQNAGRGGR